MISQSYFKGHDDDIMCLAMSPCRLYVATGQTASKTSKVWIGYDVIHCALFSTPSNPLLLRLHPFHLSFPFRSASAFACIGIFLSHFLLLTSYSLIYSSYHLTIS